MKTLKTCKSGCGKIGKMKDGGISKTKLSDKNEPHQLILHGDYQVKKALAKVKANKGQKGMSVKTKYKDGGTIVGMPEYGNNPRTYSGAILKKGGAAKNAKLAAVAPPKNKVTRADVLTRILKKKKK